MIITSLTVCLSNLVNGGAAVPDTRGRCASVCVFVEKDRGVAGEVYNTGTDEKKKKEREENARVVGCSKSN